MGSVGILGDPLRAFVDGFLYVLAGLASIDLDGVSIEGEPTLDETCDHKSYGRQSNEREQISHGLFPLSLSRIWGRSHGFPPLLIPVNRE